MSSPNYYQLAKHGDPNAIAALLNEILKEQGITTSAKRLAECLLLAITCEQIADRETLVDTVRQQLIELDARSITKVQMGARQQGLKNSAWQVEFDLEYPKPLPSLDLSLAMDDDEDEAKDGLHTIGDVIRDRYRVLEVLGQGGNGITYAATDLQQNKKVAVKALSLRHMNDWKQIELFEREAKVLSQLDHVAIPKYFDFFTIDTEEDRAFYIVQELAQGQNLAKLIEAGWRTNEKGVKKIAEQVLNILIYLHGLSPSVIHRDIKPHNLIYGDDGKVSLVDFGAVQDTYRSTMARGSTVIGTFGYMAPEQFRGQAVSATDLFSLGATILFILTHRSPSELPQERLRYDFRSKIKVSEQFADWLQKMVEPDLGDRFTSASESLASLQKKQIVWFPRRRLSWQAWVAIAGIGSILAAFIVTNKWMILGFYDINPKICESRDGDIQELVDYVKQSKNLPKKFPFYADTQRNKMDACIHSNGFIYIEILDTLIERGVKIEDRSCYNMQKDVYLDWLAFKKFNFSDQEKISSHIFGCFEQALSTRDLTKIKLLINNGLNINLKHKGVTLLHSITSSYIGDSIAALDVLKLLVDSNIDINQLDDDGSTALFNIQSMTLVKYLIKNGINVNTKNNRGDTALHSISLNSHANVAYREALGIVKLLIDSNADINAVNNRGQTPLSIAGSLEVANFLKLKGAKY